MLTFGSIMIGTSDPKKLGEFYEKVFERPSDPEETGGNWYGWKVGDGYFSVGEHSEVKGGSKEPQRIIINFEAKDVKAEFDRIKGIGASVVKEPYEMEGVWIATLADLDGNYFQLMSPWQGANK